MTDEDSKGEGGIPHTRWSLVARACSPTDPAAPAALNELLVLYHPVLKAHLVRNMGFAPEQAEDFTQSFVARKIIETNILACADQARGRFRTYLLRVFTNFAIGEIRRLKAKKRGPLNAQCLPLDELADCAAPGTPFHRAFELEWARRILAVAIQRMREECEAKGRADLWQLFACRVLDPALEGAPQPSYESLVRQFGFQSPSQASNLLITAKRMFRRVLEEVVRSTVAGEADVEEEIRDLKAILES